MRSLSLPVFLFVLANLAFQAVALAVPGENDAVGTSTAAEKYFAVTLRTSLTPISDKQAKRDIPDRPVYLIQTRAFGNNVYNLRVGFFASFDDAIAYRDSMRSTYPAASVFEIGRNEYASIVRKFPAFRLAAPKPAVRTTEPVAALPARPTPAPSQPAASTGAFSPNALFAILLEDKAQPIRRFPRLCRKRSKNYRLYSTQALIRGKQRFQLKLGFFEKESDVFAATKLMKAAYPDAKVTRITLEEQRTSVQTALRAPSAPAGGDTRTAASVTGHCVTQTVAGRADCSQGGAGHHGGAGNRGRSRCLRADGESPRRPGAR